MPGLGRVLLHDLLDALRAVGFAVTALETVAVVRAGPRPRDGLESEPEKKNHVGLSSCWITGLPPKPSSPLDRWPSTYKKSISERHGPTAAIYSRL